MNSDDPGTSVNSSLLLPKLPARGDAAPKNWLARFLLSGQRSDGEGETGRTYPWYVVLWLTGVDYFSTLGYQPGIALLAAGAVSVPATGILVAVTLLGAVPVYAEVASRSYAGQGSIALLENLLSGWQSKIFVLVLLGFAGTDFVITMTLSAADAARHAVANPYLHPYVGDRAIGLTLLLLLLLAIVFFLGFREAIGLAQVVAVPYLVLNVIVLGRGLWEIAIHPTLLAHWRGALSAHGDWTLLFVGSALVFPKLALGLSGFETGVSVMPLISNDEASSKAAEETAGSAPQGRILATRKLLLSAAVIMSVMLLLSSFVAALLIPEEAYRESGAAAGRAIAYLAHEYLGNGFGAVYDFSTILILWFAGASAMTGLLNLIPRYLPRFGMAPRWVAYRRPLVLVLFAIDVVITLIFRADVEAQGGAYATGVLVLMLSAAIAVTIALWRECSIRRPQSLLLVFYFFVITLVFVYTLIDNVIGRPDGIIIATTFIVLLLAASGISRYFRSTEMRISKASFVDQSSAGLWASITGKKVNLVPYSRATPEYREALAKKIRQYYVIDGPLAFLHVSLMDNRSEFAAELRLQVHKEGDNIVIEANGAVAIANTIAYLSESLDPITIIVELTSRNLMRQSFAYLFWGEGETGLMVYSILVRYWEWTGRLTGRPRICLMSE
ncbi:MAG TPA: hypothetical protein VLW84_06090 [Terriglobales bacterium]|nr:hypothetical protein [Terriglobales bacterium]